jgi:transposase
MRDPIVELQSPSMGCRRSHSDPTLRHVHRPLGRDLHSVGVCLPLENIAGSTRKCLCDLERRCVVDQLPDRQASTVTEWLRDHAPLDVISRDRAGAYAEAARQAAPHAVQVADRFHLIRNLREAGTRTGSSWVDCRRGLPAKHSCSGHRSSTHPAECGFDTSSTTQP